MRLINVAENRDYLRSCTRLKFAMMMIIMCLSVYLSTTKLPYVVSHYYHFRIFANVFCPALTDILNIIKLAWVQFLVNFVRLICFTAFCMHNDMCVIKKFCFKIGNIYVYGMPSGTIYCSAKRKQITALHNNNKVMFFFSKTVRSTTELNTIDKILSIPFQNDIPAIN